MGERKFKKNKPELKLSVAPGRRKLAIAVVLLTIGAVTFESELLQIFAPADSVAEGRQGSDEFSDLESILAEFGDDDASPNTPRSESEMSSQPTVADDSLPLLIPSEDAATEDPARMVSFAQESSSEKPDVHTDHGQSQSMFPAGGGYGFQSTRSDHPPAATGIRFTGHIQPIQ
ncbi:MAG TPA: hypothetical protein EYG03_23260 [Planctomycetes bacterium]|nr:hypothetical protein [Fuerstiella sp.]HIK94875.1 hypothetical protein [Planctomycetota bacterium]